MRTSAIEGRGLYAVFATSRGEIAVVKGGYILTKAQRDEIGNELGQSEIQVSDDLFIGPSTMAEREGGMMHINHSCEPNLGLQGQIVYVALRDISPGEELPPIVLGFRQDKASWALLTGSYTRK